VPYIQDCLPFGSVDFTESTALLRLPRFQIILVIERVDLYGFDRYFQVEMEDVRGIYRDPTGETKKRAGPWTCPFSSSQMVGTRAFGYRAPEPH